MYISQEYDKGERIAIGGMGEVYAGTLLGEHGFHKPVAIKQMLDELMTDARATERFIHEAQICASLDHPNVVSVLGLHRDEEGRLLLFMEYIDGLDLTALAETGRLPESLCVYVARTVFQALAYVHERGVLHRDVTPHNVLISRMGAIKLVDFGLATRMDAEPDDERTIRGKLAYLSPEQVRGVRVDQRSDLFSAGVMLYELLTGSLPFATGAEPGALAFGQVLSAALVPPRTRCPEISPEVEAVALRLLARDPEQRYASAREVLADLPEVDGGAELVALMDEVMGNDGVSTRVPATPRTSALTVPRPGAAPIPEREEPPRPRAATLAAPFGVEAAWGLDESMLHDPVPAYRRPWLLAAGVFLAGLAAMVVYRASTVPPAPSTHQEEAFQRSPGPSAQPAHQDAPPSPLPVASEPSARQEAPSLLSTAHAVAPSSESMTAHAADAPVTARRGRGGRLQVPERHLWGEM